VKLAGLLVTMVYLLGLAACGKHGSRYSRPGDDPHDTDSLYALYHQILDDSDPVFIWSETGCELDRLMDRLGPDEALRRFRALTDTVYTVAEKRRRAGVEPKLWYRDYPLDNASCAEAFEFHYVPDTARDSTHPVSSRPPPSSTRP
jgi:hypothetical protein